MDKKKYEKPTIEINLIEEKDIITTSVTLEYDVTDQFDGFDFELKF